MAHSRLCMAMERTTSSFMLLMLYTIWALDSVQGWR